MAIITQSVNLSNRKELFKRHLHTLLRDRERTGKVSCEMSPTTVSEHSPGPPPPKLPILPFASYRPLSEEQPYAFSCHCPSALWWTNSMVDPP